MKFTETNALWNETNVDRLKADLLKNYDRFSRPENYNVATQLMVAMTVIHMDLDETRGVLETHAWMRMNWSDSKLKWDPAQYDGIKELKLNADEVGIYFNGVSIFCLISFIPIRYGNQT
jgi:hypothetical protein